MLLVASINKAAGKAELVIKLEMWQDNIMSTQLDTSQNKILNILLDFPLT